MEQAKGGSRMKWGIPAPGIYNVFCWYPRRGMDGYWHWLERADVGYWTGRLSGQMRRATTLSERKMVREQVEELRKGE